MALINPQTIGDILYYILSNKDPYKKYTKNYDTYNNTENATTSILDVFSKYLGLKVEFQSNTYVDILQAGDIIQVDNRIYLITQTQGVDIPVTWPNLVLEDYNKFNNIKGYSVFRPDFNSSQKLAENLKNIAKEIIGKDSKINQLLDEDRITIQNGDRDRIYETLGDGVLQIGDLIFIVDPTQIAFNTQNGYQYFPTIRTAGNPKIPTSEQIKNISINLIFPNEDSINYQLLNLYAMFRRTPFVNLRNKDISAFFKDICFMDWVSVALESIQVQSVEGFPNTLQASITLLPFDYRTISSGFQALLSMKDVERQQALLYNNASLDELIRKSESKLNEQSITPERFIDLVLTDIKKSPDFRNSLPFRAFYQSLIAERKFILNNYGEPVPVTNGSSFDITKFRPSKQENMLHEYIASDNQKSITLKYSYIPENFRDITKKISDQRTDKQIQLLTDLNKLYSSIKTKDDIIGSIVTVFANEKDFFNITEAQFSEIDNRIDTIMTRYGITLEKKLNEPHPIKSLFGLVRQGIGVKLGIRSLVETTSDFISIMNGKFTPDATDIVGYWNGLTFTDSKTHGVGTFQWGIKKIWDWINTGTPKEIENNKKNFSSFMTDLRQNIQKELGLIDSEEMIIINPTEDGELFSVHQLPIQQKQIEIDNRNDIVTGWSLVFANKFVPIELQSFKYPYYQHIGCEDVSISLSIISTSEKTTDLKSELSLLSERLHETVKIINFTAPELITYLDGRVSIDVGTNHLFRVFGIQKVVFDASNTVSINNQPGSWQTTVNLTQANFTISDYHSVTSIPSDDIARTEISKLISYLEPDSDSFKIVKYKNKQNNEILNLSVNDIIRFKFLKKYGSELNNHIVSVKEEGNNNITGGTISDKIQNDINTLLGIEEVVDPATNQLKSLLIEYPQFKKIIQFLVSRIDGIMAQRLSALTQIIFPNRSIINNFHNSLKKYLGGNLGILVSAGLLISFFLVPPIIGSAALAVSAFGGAVFIKRSLDAAAETGQLEIKERLISKLDKIFLSLEDMISSAISMEFAEKILRDPVIYKKFITPETIGKTVFDNIENSKNKSRINCYNDFDIPYISDTITLGPDFYLYNNVSTSIETRTYITEATKRYAKVGKLTTLMALTEATEILKKYDNIITSSENIEEDIKESVKTNLVTSLIEDKDADIKKLITSLENVQDQVSLCVNSLSEKENISATNAELLNEFRTKYAKELTNAGTKEEYEYAYKVLAAKVTRSEGGIAISNIEFNKINIIKTARMKTMLEIFEVYTVINSYLLENQLSVIQNIGKSEKTTKTTELQQLINGTKSQADLTSAKTISEAIRYILLNPTITSQTLMTAQSLNANTDESTALKKGIAKHFENGLSQSVSVNSIQLPGIQRIENYLYNKIGYYVRLNTFLQDYAKVGGDNAIARVNLDTLPELKFLDFWNFRAIEENQRKINIIKDFENSYDSKKNTTIKMFPTFKLFFVEEDKGFITHNFDDYYTHNAIQSIEIITNKNTPGKVAVIRLSNVTNSLTDRMSLLRESEDIFGHSATGTGRSKNLFFGTLDVKPGTQIIIKMGYAPFDNLLIPVFQGRIIEMNNGPMVELICQSFGTQLNHNIVAEKFGLLSTVKDYGDVASALLDVIPGLEKLGKQTMLGLSNTGDFTGRNIRNIRGKFGDKFLMSNLIGGLSSMTFAQDNPRDENIYLNYSTVNNIYHHPTFDWVVFDQSVWNALKEINLYHRNVITSIKSYNDDSLSTNNNLRETLVIGDKAGYYKFNDAFSLSTLNIREVDKAVNDFQQIRNTIRDLNNINSLYTDNRNTTNQSNFTVYGTPSFTLNNVIIRLNEKAKPIYSFLQNRLNALVLVAHLINIRQGVKANINFIEALNNTMFDNKFFPASDLDLVQKMITFSKDSSIPDDDILTTNFYEPVNLNNFNYFKDIVKGLRKILLENPNFEINAEEYYNVKDVIINNDVKLSNNPQYKKIQQHHLINDSDIISNNISLNSNFSNVVNVYYTGEPKIKTASLDRLDDDFIRKNLNIWTVKAFGDQNDENTRPLNSYQKNIDTNWFDVHNKTNSFFEKYKRVKMDKYTGQPKKFNDPFKKSTDELNIPSWDVFPSFVVVGVKLLQQEVEKMYQGTIEIVGNPNIQPYDILHIQDYVNDMHGVVEVEEVIHTFTPDRGFKTVITPNLITYDRDPIQMQDIQVINQIYDFATTRRNIDIGANFIAGAVAIAAGSRGGTVGLGIGALAAGLAAYNGTVGALKRHHAFIYDQMGHILGRDCINFTSLLYHGVPYMAGFDGVDYTNLKTLMNHSVVDIKNPITRYLAFSNVLKANLTTGWNPSEFGLLQKTLGQLSETGE